MYNLTPAEQVLHGARYVLLIEGGEEVRDAMLEWWIGAPGKRANKRTWQHLAV